MLIYFIESTLHHLAFGIRNYPEIHLYIIIDLSSPTETK